jgi:hypothetical protein
MKEKLSNDYGKLIWKNYKTTVLISRSSKFTVWKPKSLFLFKNKFLVEDTDGSCL